MEQTVNYPSGAEAWEIYNKLDPVSYLAHHGIKGQKWGVRRFRNIDGSLTEEGKKRYSGNGYNGADSRPSEKSRARYTGTGKAVSEMSDDELQRENKRMSAELTYNKLQDQLGKNKKPKTKLENAYDVTNQARNVQQQLRNSMPKPKSKEPMDLSHMTDKELRDAINREQLERQYKDLFAKPSRAARGAAAVQKVMDVAGGALMVTSSALGLALAIQKIRNGG